MDKDKAREESPPARAKEYELVYAASERALAQQQTVLDGLRTRASILISAAAIATSFLGAQALRPPAPNPRTGIAPEPTVHVFGWVAIAFFGLVGLFTILILFPRGDWRFRLSPRAVIRDYVESKPPSEITEMHRDLALHMEDDYAKNDEHLRTLFNFLRLACLFLVLEVVMWIIDLGNGVNA
jgi:hypothetical protein